MYLHGLSNDDISCKKRFESYEESSKKNQIRMVTLFGQQVYTAKGESFVSGIEQVNRNCLNPLMKDCDLLLLENHESVECREFHSIGCSQDTIWIEAYGTNMFGKKSEKVNISDGSGLLDLNKSPAYEPVSNDYQCGLNGVHEKDWAASPASCCTAENSSKIEGEDSCEVIQMAAECLVHISAVTLNQSQDQEILNNHKMGVQEPGRSCDSFELHTLGIRETIPEELCCVSSKAIDNFSNKKEFGVKLRRGRRMKNFQKEILLELVSLSRHEIREDINLLETILRSRDYKKMQGKNTKDGKCRPNRRNNKGLTQRYVGKMRRQSG
ncbi:unnamed protein product [Arabidopsis lyrata]|uniref:Uncharacterized protein n=1 Tax=Arabidopsis lyrata subsp. lyrata TaxID=81972 RepID=D7KUP6_ARALL|nr:uncharacterized protein LOC9324084 [Arabidopsis lyrata subsp. lyrata]EFH62724.1 hypothetical protein ARALYDRAFT_315144 [Arabidopsis lyrata subsp. lyrata]CAH8256110.1 unnamed protein product [Arabidopsis lyrata]|eukprot:XP_002886465.1 uncharacterized protein LOC9324084 [Arabidopsis lyrata subsp. lyrata]